MVLTERHPAVLFAYFTAIPLVMMFSSNPIFPMTALLGGCLLSILLRRNEKMYRSVLFYLGVFLLVTITNPLFSHEGETVLFLFLGVSFTWEALLYGASLSCVMIGVLIWCRCYTVVMTSERFLYLFGSVVPKTALVLSMTFRLIPLFLRRLQGVSHAQKTMGMYAVRGFRARVKCAGRIFSAVIALSLDRAMDTAASMRARGYGSGKRSLYTRFRFRVWDGLSLLLLFFLLGVIFVSGATDVVSFSYYPRITALPHTPSAIFTYAAFAVLSFAPFCMEIREVIRWKFYRSKI